MCLRAPLKGGNAQDLTPGDFDSPPHAASSNVDFSFSPDGKEVAFVKKSRQGRGNTTKQRIYVVVLSGAALREILPLAIAVKIATPVYTMM